MSNPTATHNAKLLHKQLLDLEVIDVWTHGLVGNQLYISSNKRAYRLKELSDAHLQRIIEKYQREERGEPLPAVLLERERRVEAGEYDPFPNPPKK